MAKTTLINQNFNYQDLMLYRIHEILLIASPYDAYILEQDGKLTEQILNEYLGMNLSYAPRVWNATSAKEGIDMLGKRSYDLIIIMMRIPDMNSIQLGQNIKEQFPKKPVVLLAFDESEVKRISYKQKSFFDEIFIWYGNSNVFTALIKCIEDKKNLSRDIRKADLRAIVFIEDTPKYYSSLLPMIYKEIIFHTKKLIDKSLNDTQKLLHMRARPKILLATNYEEAKKVIKKYHLNILGIISDIRFPIKGKIDDTAGIKLIDKIRKYDTSIPVIFQSNRKMDQAILDKYSAKFLDKNSPRLFKELRNLLINNFGFGDFKFRMPKGKIIAQASTIEDLKNNIEKAPKASLAYHASYNHISNWLATRGEFKIASKFRAIKADDYKDIEKRRAHHLQILNEMLITEQRLPIVEFSSTTIKQDHNFIRIGDGSLGGKARGLAFANSILHEYKFKKNFPEINIRIPKIIVISTDEFDEFMETNNLWDVALSANNNSKIEKEFLASKLPKDLIKKLKLILRHMKYPLAIRSSSLLEDSQYKPLAGMYKTFMLPNANKKTEPRLNQLSEAIKRVYASTFYKEPKALMDSVSQRYEEEKMAIIIMELIGKNHDNTFYPTFSGVCQSYNYYPVSHMDRKDGVAFLALGLGKTVADGEKSLRYSPEYPEILPQYYSVKSAINNSQNKFYALDLKNEKELLYKGEEGNLNKYDLEIAERHNELKHIANVVINEDNIIRESLKYKGPRVLTFSSIIKYNYFPLNSILNEFIKQGENFIGCPFEIEFAVNIHSKKKSEFCLLQVKPMAIDNIDNDINILKISNSKSTFCFSKQVLGDGSFDKIKHIVYIDINKFQREKTQNIADKIGLVNKKLGSKSPYLLLGPGRWGTSDPWLGIPVNWEQISNAKSIIEIGIDSLNPDPSFGSHFFQNLTSLRIGYFTINRNQYKKDIDWSWLRKQKHTYKNDCVNIVELKKPIIIKIDGINGRGIILKDANQNNMMNEDDSSGI